MENQWVMPRTTDDLVSLGGLVKDTKDLLPDHRVCIGREDDCPVARRLTKLLIDKPIRIEIVHQRRAMSPQTIHKLTLAGMIILAIFLLMSATGHAFAQSRQNNSQVDSYIVTDTELSAKIVALKERLDETEKKIQENRNETAANGKELARIEGMGGGILALMSFLQFLVYKDTRKKTGGSGETQIIYLKDNPHHGGNGKAE